MRVALDTGATSSCISPDMLSIVGLEPDRESSVRELATGNGCVQVRIVSTVAVRCLGQTRADLPVVSINLPARTGIDGLLGLDFLRDFDLRIDFRNGLIELA